MYTPFESRLADNGLGLRGENCIASSTVAERNVATRNAPPTGLQIVCSVRWRTTLGLRFTDALNGACALGWSTHENARRRSVLERLLADEKNACLPTKKPPNRLVRRLRGHR
ncbi:hypothetical protein X566_05005 [Afipia sp. P52-10]|jgi:hypothetical protein|nr:hypothetical protein X566_05005 [Afipia sp. P52-10]